VRAPLDRADSREEIFLAAPLSLRFRSPFRLALAAGIALAALPFCRAGEAAAEPKKQYWATSLSGTVDSGILQGLQDAVARGEQGWLDVSRRASDPARAPGINLILYHVGGNCRIGDDCRRFPASQPTRDGWGDSERAVDLADPPVRAIVIADLMRIVQSADQIAARGATVGVHLDNVHRLDADGLAKVFNEYLQGVEALRKEGLIGRDRAVGYIAKNNPAAFARALEERSLAALPLYQVNENATLGQDGRLDRNSRVAQETGRRYGIPVFLKTFGTDVAHVLEQNGGPARVYVSPEMTRQMAQMPDIAGAAWSPDERRYQPTLFAQGAAVEGPLPYRLGAASEDGAVRGRTID
jgi:hypothetical protein